MNDELERQITAKIAAHRFVISFLLRSALLPFKQKDREFFVEEMIRAATQTGQFSRATKDDDFAAERLADVVFQTQEIVRQMLHEALEACRPVQS